MKSISEATFTAWSERLRKSDASAYEALFRAVYSDLFRYARSFTKDDEAAQDIVQEAFLRLWDRRASLNPDRSLKALLFVSVRNRALNQERNIVTRQSLLATMDKPTPAPTPDEKIDAEMLGARIRAWIDELPERRREAFHLSRFGGLSYAEIATIMDVSIKTVENHIRLALQNLRSRLREYEPDLLES